MKNCLSISIFVLFFCTAHSLNAQEYAILPTIPVWSQGIPDQNGVAGKHLEYKKNPSKTGRFDGLDRVVSEVKVPTLEVFKPRTGKNNKAVIVCPGGAYRFLSYIKEGQDIARWFAELGYTAYVLAYRCPDTRIGALQDVQRAIRIARGDGFEKVGVIGFSAGGSLSCRAATLFNEKTYEPQDSLDSLSARPTFGILIYPAYLNEGPDGTLTPELKVTKETSPLFVFGTEDDRSYSGPSSLVIAEAMRKAGAPIELHYLAKGGHGYGMHTAVGHLWPTLLETWLKGF